jgi:hypothetical protein
VERQRQTIYKQQQRLTVLYVIHDLQHQQVLHFLVFDEVVRGHVRQLEVEPANHVLQVDSLIEYVTVPITVPRFMHDRNQILPYSVLNEQSIHLHNEQMNGHGAVYDHYDETHKVVVASQDYTVETEVQVMVNNAIIEDLTEMYVHQHIDQVVHIVVILVQM